ncbi:MAG: hypothetical protein ACF8R7_17955 [Phycisphaerales bacterium JB039]
MRSFLAALVPLIACAAAAAQELAPPAGAAPPAVGPADAALVDQILAESPKGRLAIHAVQGSAGGDPVGSVDVQVDLYHNNRPLKQLTATLDENGVVVLEDVPIILGVRPVVKVEYGGVTYLEVGAPMDAENPEAVVTVTVYETTDETPQWDVAMRHVIAEPTPEGAVVGETLVVQNPADRTWLGGPPDAQDRRTTVRVHLPEGARDVQLTSGFHGWCCTTLEGNELAVQMPLMPGQTTFQYSYMVPPHDGHADLRITAPAPMRTAVFFVPMGGDVEAIGMQEAEAPAMGGAAQMRMFQAQDIASGQEMGVVLTGGAVAAAASGSAAHARLLALIGAGLVVVAIIGVMAVRAGRQRQRAAGAVDAS